MPLAELDLAGNAPAEVVLAGPDRLVIVNGDTLAIQTEGDDEAVAALRFSLDGDTLVIMREGDSWGSSDDGQATITVTMPTPSELNSLGSGSIDAQSLGGKASATIAGSGDIEIDNIAASGFDVSILGSGSFTSSGTSDTLDLTVAGSGSFGSPGLNVGDADVSILGSGSASFASDGRVDASITGSGNVIVSGNPTCESESMGSGTITCGSVDNPAGAGSDAR